jgi:hypothetical protein
METDVETDQRFYARRIAEELSRAASSITPAARERHQQLAAQFVERARQLEPRTKSSPFLRLVQ